MSRMDNFSGADDLRFVPATLRGFRQWRVQYSTRLSSAVFDINIRSINWEHWPNGEMRAECRSWSGQLVHEKTHPDIPSPVKGCTCGIYSLAFQDDWDVNNPLRSFDDVKYSSLGSSFMVSGVGRFGGKILFGTLGYRAQKAAIEAVHLPKPTDAWSYRFREGFKAEFPNIMVFSSIDMMYEQFPEDDFSSLYDAETYQKIKDARTAYRLQREAQREMLRVRREAPVISQVQVQRKVDSFGWATILQGSAPPPPSFPGKIYDIP